MKARMAGFVSGFIILYWSVGRPDLKYSYFNSAITLILLFVVLLLKWYRRQNQVKLTQVISVLGFAFFGASLFSIAVNQFYAQKFPAEYFHQNLTVEGYLCSLPVHHKKGVSFDFCLSRIYDQHSHLLLSRDRKIHLWSFFLPDRSYFFTSDSNKMIAIVIKLSTKKYQKNPIGFDAETWNFRHQIVAKGRVVSWYGKRQGDLSCSWGCQYSLWRWNFLIFLNKKMENYEHRGLMLALSMGYRGEIPSNEKNLLSITATQHLVAISGLHIGLIAGLFWLLARRMLGRFLWLEHIQSKLCLVVSLAAATMYAALAGFPVSAQRALIMLGCFYLFSARKQQTGFSTVLLIAASLILLVDPLAIMDIGFWLSFSAVGLLLFFGSHILSIAYSRHFQSSLRLLMQSQWIIWLGLMPVIIALGMPISIISIPANILAVPLIGGLTLPVLLAADVTSFHFPDFASWLFQATDVLLEISLQWLSALQGLSQKTYGLEIKSFLIFLPVVALSVLILPGFSKLRFFVFSVLLLLILNGDVISSPEQLRLLTMDLGGSSLTIVSHQKRAIIYADGASLSRYVLSQLVSRYLSRLRIDRVDAFYISSGRIRTPKVLVNFFKAWHVKKVYLGGNAAWDYEEYPSLPEFRNCLKDQYDEWGSVYLQIFSQLNKSADAYKGKVSKSNKSCVLGIRNTKVHILMTGKLNRAGFNRLLKKNDFRGLHTDVWITRLSLSKIKKIVVFIKGLRPEFIISSARPARSNKFKIAGKTNIKTRVKTTSYNKNRITISSRKSIPYLNTNKTGGISFHIDLKNHYLKYSVSGKRISQFITID